MMFKLSRIETYALIQCCHCRTAEIDRSVENVFADMSERQPDQIGIATIIALDGERHVVEQLLNRLWEHSKGRPT